MKSALSIVACVSLLTSLLAATPPALAQDTTSHAEECTTWGFIQDINYEFGVVNTCDFAISVWFLSASGARAQGDVAPGASFSSGLTPQSVDLSQWLAAVCRSGYRPNVNVSPENGDAIVNGQYICVRN